MATSKRLLLLGLTLCLLVGYSSGGIGSSSKKDQKKDDNAVSSSGGDQKGDDNAVSSSGGDQKGDDKRRKELEESIADLQGNKKRLEDALPTIEQLLRNTTGQLIETLNDSIKVKTDELAALSKDPEASTSKSKP